MAKNEQEQTTDIIPAITEIGEKTWLGKLNKVIWMQYLNCISSCMRTVSLKKSPSDRKRGGW